MGDSDYSFSLTTFAPSGKLVAVENALAAVGAGTLSVGVKAKNGVVIAVDKKVKDKLCDTSTIRKVEPLFTNVGCTFSGMGPDFRVLVSRGRKQVRWVERVGGPAGSAVCARESVVCVCAGVVVSFAV